MMPESGSDPELRESLEGEVALVTGANRGIGAETARRLSALGATVYAGVRRSRYDVPEDQRRVFLDVTQRGDIASALKQIREEAGRLDVLVNNAGVSGPDAPLHEAEVSDLDRTLGTNLRGPLLLCKAALPLLLEREAPRVVNLSSGMGTLRDMGGGSPAYRVSKAGLNGLTAYLHGEYREAGLIANAASPGWVQTDMGGSEAPRSVEEGAETPVWLARFAAGAPGGGLWRDRERVGWD
jgi:NAD(P)-dependent dehydrogenase (short-subunit alcohol dehydrogenase family)